MNTVKSICAIVFLALPYFALAMVFYIAVRAWSAFPSKEDFE